MKLTNTLHRLKIQFLAKLPSNDIYLKLLISVCVLIFISAGIWIGGPHLSWANYTPLAQADKRLYIILFLFLIWLLKFLIIDLDAPNPAQFKDPLTQKKLENLQSRFQGALQFLKKTTVSRPNGPKSLNELPWYLLIGPTGAGKTSLLANSNVNFILQKQFSNQDKQNIETSEHCDWWITRDASIIDVPGKYLSTHITAKDQKRSIYAILWNFFLRLIKKQRGKNGISGIVIALPLPEIMKQGDTKKYHALLRDLFQRLNEVQIIFPHTIPCQLIITKCDLLSGFNEFFAEAGNDEITQAWGITLTESKQGEKIYDVFGQRFNALIKRLNQQLLWRLHQERNPMARPYIKDFPLQIERLKEFTQDFIKKLSVAHSHFSLSSVYLTSALQNKPESETDALDDVINSSQRSVQIFKEPLPVSRAYFIKQLITHGFSTAKNEQPTPAPAIAYNWKSHTSIILSIGIIGYAVYILGKDFEQGIKQTYAIQNELSQYQLTIQQFHDPNNSLIQTSKLLDTLQKSSTKVDFQLDLTHLLSFYSQKSQMKAAMVYRQALQTILLPEIKNYFEDYLKRPIDKNTDNVYAVLKAYLMLGDASYFQADTILDTIQQILPQSIDASTKQKLMSHIKLALNTKTSLLLLDKNTIDQTRKFLTGMPSLKLSYIILKSINSNNVENEISFGADLGNNIIFISKKNKNKIPFMFTAKAFSAIYTQDINVAAQEAMVGNWILGEIPGIDKSPETIAALAQQLRVAYVNNYIDTWETLLNNINLSKPKDLAQADAFIADLISNNSPLLQLLQLVYENTYFEPIISTSPKLQGLGLLLDKNHQSDNLLYQIFSGLQSLHQYIQSVLTAENEKKAAFEIISNRVKNLGTSDDAITQLRMIALKSPEPVKNWLEKIANDTWYFLMQEAGRYLDTSWQNKVMPAYQNEIANRYPFNADAEREVELQKFINFFGNPGTVLSFYNDYLRALIDTSSQDWRWKSIDNNRLPFSDETLRQIQQAMRIHRSFFPNGDKKLYIQFALQPYKFDKNIRNIKLNINDKLIVDDTNGTKNPHVFTWPSSNKQSMTSIQLTLSNQKVFYKKFPGDWGWFKLMNQSFENAITRKQLMLNFSINDQPVKYVLFTEGQPNPFLALNFRQFHLPQKLTEQQ